MAKNWMQVLNNPAPGSPEIATAMEAWNIPVSAVSALSGLISTADTDLLAALNEETRTHVVNARCKQSFGELVAYMRDFKRRY
jgi:hypothetical protein